MCDLSYQVSDEIFTKNGFSNIIKYNELSNYKSLLELLPQPLSYVVILIENKHNQGHWTCMVRKSITQIYYFDSYGAGIDQEFKFISPEKQDELGESVKYLSLLIDKLPPQISILVNRVPYQIDDPRICTCGRYCLFFLLSVVRGGATMSDFKKFLTKVKNECKITYDKAICILTKNFL